MVEPAGTDRYVRLGRHIGVALRVPGVRYAVFRKDVGRIDRRPARISGNSVFIADPPDVAAFVGFFRRPDNAFRHVFMQRIGPFFVIRLAYRIDVTGPVLPDFVQRTVWFVFAQFNDLVAIVGRVRRRSEAIKVPVPRRQIYGGLNTVFMTGIGKLPEYITLSGLPRAVPDAMFRVFGRPQAESVMMLDDENGGRYAAGFKHAAPLSAVQIRGIE
jgi:hypothetical protein